MNLSIKRKFSITDFISDNYQVVIFSVYLVMLSIAISYHEPWMDEAQAWLLAKDAGLKELFTTYLRYEGSPGLWHIILMVAAKLGLPYISINIISGVFSSAGVWLFIRYSPFPRIVKILYPFSFFVFFQYGVVARSYCLVAPVMFLIALIYPAKQNRPYLFVLLLALLANISAHTFIIAGSIAVVHCIDLLTGWKTLSRRSQIHQIVSLSFLAAVAACIFLIIKTPPDHIFASYLNLDPENFKQVSKRMIGGSLVMDEFTRWPNLFGTIAFLIVFITFIWLRKNNMALLYFLPLFLLSVLFAIKYRNLWHQGILFLLWVFVLWLSLQKYFSGEQRYIVWQKPIVGLMAFVVAVQTFWTIYSVSYDIKYNYSAGRTTARYIKRKGLDKKNIYVSGWKIISILPYFQKNIFSNLNAGSGNRFWNWSTNNVTSVGASPFILDTITCLQPEVVIFASDHIPRHYKIELPGYRPVAFFKGYLCWKTGIIEPECYLMFRKYDEETKQFVFRDTNSGNYKNLQ